MPVLLEVRGRRVHASAALLVVIVLAGASCGGGAASVDCGTCGTGGGAKKPVLTQLLVSPGTATLRVGESASFSVDGRDATGAAMSTGALTIAWATSDTKIATVTGGTATGVAAGTTTLTATIGTVQGSATLTVTPAAVAAVTVAIDSSSLQVGHSAQARATLLSATGAPLTDRPVVWSSESPNIAKVDASSGIVTAVAVGAAVIVATSEGKTGTATLLATAAPIGPTTIRLTGPAATGPISVDDDGSVNVSAMVNDQNGQPVATLPAAFDVQWSSDAPAAATVARQSPVSSATIVGRRGGSTFVRVALVRAGTNAVVASDSVLVRVQQVPSTLSIVSGTVDTSVVGTTLSAPILVQVKDRFGGPDSNAIIDFRLIGAAGTLGTVSPARATTNASGQASTSWTLGKPTGANTLGVSVIGRAAVATTVTTYAKPDAAVALSVMQGASQTGATGDYLKRPVLVAAVDRFGNAVGNVSVLWTQRDVDGTVVQQLSTTTGAGGAPVSFDWALTANGGSQSLSVSSGTMTQQITATALVPDHIALCNASGSSCIQPGDAVHFGNDATQPYPMDTWYVAIVKVFNAAGTVIPSVPIVIQSSGTATARTRIPGQASPAPRADLRTARGGRSSVASRALGMASRLLSDDVIDIRGAASGQGSMDISTASSIPQVGVQYITVAAVLEPFPTCNWSMKVASAPAAFPTLKVGETATFALLPSNCPPGANTSPSSPIRYTLSPPYWTSTTPIGGTEPVTLDVSGTPDLPIIEITGATPGATTLTFSADMTKRGRPHPLETWLKFMTFPAVSITVVP